jgi:EAL domain-containing protein (putative c-di-GMP-specific phosphodiesterase class I)
MREVCSRALRASGVKIWLDDFGTGFSGLSHLRRGAGRRREDRPQLRRRRVARSRTTSRSTDRRSSRWRIRSASPVVAEGVEKEGQYAILRERGCDLAQGYWLGHPVEARTTSACCCRNAR